MLKTERNKDSTGQRTVRDEKVPESGRLIEKSGYGMIKSTQSFDCRKACK